jgi:hypothetical protein
MAPMKRAAAIIGLLMVSACGGGGGSQHAKTPDELIADQEKAADEQAAESKRNPPPVSAEETDAEKKAKFDKKQADLELKRAARSAETCPNSVSEPGPAGTAKVTLMFQPDGHVKEASIGAPFTDTAVGKCVINAMKAVIIPAYEGGDESVDWEIELKAAETKKEEPKGKTPAKKK